MEPLEVVGMMAVPTVLGAVAWGKMKQEVASHALELANKAGTDVVEAKFAAVIERLDRIERGIDRLSGENAV